MRKPRRKDVRTRRMIWVDGAVHQATKIRAAEDQTSVRELTELALIHYLHLGEAIRRPSR